MGIKKSAEVNNILTYNYNAVYGAWRNFRKGKKANQAIDEFAYNLELNLHTLSEQLNNQTYRHGSYRPVILLEKKRRDLAVAEVRDRIVHRLLYDYLVKIYDTSFDPDVWSCRVDKGLHACLSRTQQLLRRHPNSYIWRADIVKFFENVDHHILAVCLKRKLGPDGALWLCREVIGSYNASSKQASKVYRLAI